MNQPTDALPPVTNADNALPLTASAGNPQSLNASVDDTTIFTAGTGDTQPTVPLIELRDLTVRLGGREILRGLSADVPRGQITALIGLNGCGKTTLLRTLLGQHPHTGSIRFRCGHDHTLPMPQHIGYVPQRLTIEAHFPLTVRDLFGLALQRRPIIFGISRRTEALMRQLLERVNAGADYLDLMVEKLSGGQLQRVLLALALWPPPELLLLDEPAAAVDFADQEGFYRLIREVNAATGVTVLLISHDLSAVRTCADHVLCMHHGRIVSAGTPAQVLTTDELARVYGLHTQRLTAC